MNEHSSLTELSDAEMDKIHGGALALAFDDFCGTVVRPIPIPIPRSGPLVISAAAH